MLDARAHIIYIDGKIGPNIPPQALCPHFPVNIFAGSRGKHYLWHVVRLTTPSTPFYMSKVRIPINPMQVGRVGAYSMYVRAGEQIVRQRKNSSNYGPEASRTESQMSRRVCWANLVDFYKACKSWMPKAFETKTAGQTDYNKFMQLNINSARVFLTKDMAANGCAVPDAFMVSQGSLAPLTITAGNLGIGTLPGIKLDTAIQSSSTIANISADILRNNPIFQNGDNIAFINFKCVLDSRGYPYTSSVYHEFTIDTGNSSQWGQNSISAVLESATIDSQLQLAPKASYYNASMICADVWIHTRKVGGALQVSTQQIFIWEDTDLQQFSTQGALQAAIDSYGVDTDVPLDPSFNSAVIQKVLWNGSVVYQKGVTSGRFRVQDTEGGELEIQGSGLYGRDVKLFFFDGSESVEYTPLEVTEDSWKYILTGNGTYTLVGNKFVLGSLTLSGIETPEELTSNYQIAQTATATTPLTDGVNVRSVQALCVNYPYKSSSSYPYFRMTVGVSTEPSESDLVGHNCTLSAYGYSGQDSRFRIAILPTNTSEPCWVEYKDFIIAVCNYSS